MDLSFATENKTKGRPMSLREALERRGTWTYFLERAGGSVLDDSHEALEESSQPRLVSATPKVVMQEALLDTPLAGS